MKVLFFANTDWYIYNFRFSLALALRGLGYDVVFITPNGQYSEKFEEAGFRWIPFEFQRKGINPFIEIITIFRLWKLYRNEKPEFVHHFTIKCVLYGSIAAHFSGIKKIINAITGVGYVFTQNDFKARVIRFFVNKLYRVVLRNTQVVFQNDDDKKLFIDKDLILEKNTSVIKGSGVDIDKFYSLPEPYGEPIIVLAARLLFSKGIEEFVRAAEIIKSKEPKVRFVIVGDAYPENPDAIPDEKLSNWKNDGMVEFWGWEEDMLSVYKKCHIICLPSYREGLPRSLLEGAACARPLIATDVPGCREIVLDGNNGFLVENKNIDQLVEKLMVLIKDRGLRSKMGERGRKIVENSFSTQIVNSLTTSIYQKMR
ncbi:MAG: glycosyltransferase family 4 protein [Anaerolineaceae bacterium]|nr:glycosyltransferase family 4 protein [Anaerolineaceae bacterium]